MPRVKNRFQFVHLSIEERYEKALNGLEDGTFKSLQKAATAYNLSKSSLGHRKNGRQSRQIAHQAE